MAVEFVAGDLLNPTVRLDAIGHGCNCLGVMGAGIAYPIRQRWPDMYEEYRILCAAGKLKPGDIFVWPDGDHVVYNLMTQRMPGSDAKVEYIAKSLSQAIGDAETRGIKTIGLPMLGAGLGGLLHRESKEAISKAFAKTTVTAVVYETYVPARYVVH